MQMELIPRVAMHAVRFPCMAALASGDLFVPGTVE